MNVFSNYSKRLLSIVFATLLSSSVFVGCAADDNANPSASNRPMVAAQMPGQADLGQAIAAQNRHTDALMAHDGVIGTGTGVNDHGAPVIYVFTSKPGVVNIPTELDHFPTHVEYIGEVKALAGGKGGGGKPTPGFRATYRSPMWSGVSVGNNGECAAGTLGCVVTKNNHYYLLSNNHVFARENHAAIGEAVGQPGRYDNSCNVTGQVAALSEFVPIVFGGNNTVDAAIAEISGGIVWTSQMALGTYTPTATPRAPLVGMTVKKTGRTTGFTQATISAINVNVNVGYSGGTARFVGQIYIGGRGTSAAGDSGSLFVESNSNDPVGLLFAGSRTSTIACPIGDVLNAFGVTIVPN